MELNTKKIMAELKRLDKNQLWLANQCKQSRQLMSYWMRNKTIKAAEPIGKALDIEPRDLIK